MRKTGQLLQQLLPYNFYFNKSNRICAHGKHHKLYPHFT